jgi:hypothetical protein
MGSIASGIRRNREMQDTMVKVNPGDLVYVETFPTGLIKGKYVYLADYASVANPNGGHPGVAVKLTQDKGPYKRGEILVKGADAVIPRANVKRRRGNLIITGLFRGWVFNVMSSGELVPGLTSR